MRLRVLSVLVIVLLAISGMSVNFAAGQARSADRGFNWLYPAYDKQATNFSPQTQITKGTIGRLQDAWATANPVPPVVPGVNLSMGVSARPLMSGGIIYLTPNALLTVAYKTDSGFVTWGYAFPVNMTQVQIDVPSIKAHQSGVIEGITIFEDDVLMPTPDCGIVKLNTLGGVPSFAGDLARGHPCDKVVGNEGVYTGQMLYAPVAYDAGRVLITGTGVSGNVESGRGYVAGYDADTGKELWKFFLMPPAGGDQNWAMQYKGKGNVDPTPRDWGNARGVGVGVAYGQWAVDEETGIVYVGTSAPAPSFNATRRPGPNLFSSSVLALDAKTGGLKWYYQTSPHDLYAHGCAWNTALGKIGDKKVLFKACDNGRLYALDAATGKLVWSFLPPSIKYLNVEDSFGKQVDYNKRTAVTTNAPHWQCPGITGATGGDIAFAYNKIYYATTNLCDYLRYTSVEPGMKESPGAEFMKPTLDMPKNTTVYALDASSGKVTWKYDIPNVSHRGGLIVTGGMVFVGSLDGNLYGLDAETGNVAFEKYFASPLGNSPIIAASAQAEQFMIINVGGVPERFAESVSGLVFAFKLRSNGSAPADGKPAQPITQPQAGLPELSFEIIIPVVAVAVIIALVIALRVRKGKKKVNT